MWSLIVALLACCFVGLVIDRTRGTHERWQLVAPGLDQVPIYATPDASTAAFRIRNGQAVKVIEFGFTTTQIQVDGHTGYVQTEFIK